MDIKDFQLKLGQVLAQAKADNHQISVEEVEAYFKEDNLSKEQLDKVYDYLQAQNILIQGRTERKISLSSIKHDVEEKIPLKQELTPQDQEYLERYKRSLQQLPPVEETPESLYEKSLKGDEAARQTLVEIYMPKVIDLALEADRQYLPLAELIAEGNVHLVLAVNRITSVEDAREEILSGIRKGIDYFIEEQIQQKQQDNSLVDKVRKLEAAIKKLTDGDDDMEFSVEELSVYLDMPRSEIEDILRLTADASENK